MNEIKYGILFEDNTYLKNTYNYHNKWPSTPYLAQAKTFTRLTDAVDYASFRAGIKESSWEKNKQPAKEILAIQLGEIPVIIKTFMMPEIPSFGSWQNQRTWNQKLLSKIENFFKENYEIK